MDLEGELHMTKKQIFIVFIIGLILTGCGLDDKNVTSPVKEFDIKPYIGKVWIVKDKDERNNEENSIFFMFTKEDNNKITGKFGIADNNFYDLDTLFNGQEDIGKLSGEISNDTAQCQFEWEEEGVFGTIDLVFKNEIAGTVKNQDEKGGKKVCEGQFCFKEYNINDTMIEGCTYSHEINKNVNIRPWEDTCFVSKVYTTPKHHRVVQIYLTDSAGSIIYEFNTKYGFPEGLFVKEFSFQDINRDEKDDLILILDSMGAVDDEDGGGPYKAYVFRQKYDNTFEWEEDLDEQLNNYDNVPYNQDVETVNKYLERINYVDSKER